MNILPALVLSVFMNAPVAVLAQDNATAPGTVIEMPSGLKKYRVDTHYVNSGVTRQIGYSYTADDTYLAQVQKCWLRVYNLERANEVQWEDKNLPKPVDPDPIDPTIIKAQYPWVPPRTGHYYFEVACCRSLDETDCSAFSSSLDASAVEDGRAFWIFAWPAPPIFP